MVECGAAVYEPITSWDTSQVTDMSSLFASRSDFNANIGSWNTGAVKTMTYMFAGANTFNQDIGSWNTTAVRSMNGMFLGRVSSFKILVTGTRARSPT